MYCLLVASLSDVPNFGCGCDVLFDSAIRPKVDENWYAPGPGDACELDNPDAGTCGLIGPWKN